MFNGRNVTCPTRGGAFVFLLVAALSIFASSAWAQPAQQQYVVIYVEFKPSDTKAGAECSPIWPRTA